MRYHLFNRPDQTLRLAEYGFNSTNGTYVLHVTGEIPQVFHTGKVMAAALVAIGAPEPDIEFPAHNLAFPEDIAIEDTAQLEAIA
jgi:hypothetical protein